MKRIVIIIGRAVVELLNFNGFSVSANYVEEELNMFKISTDDKGEDFDV